MKIFGTMYQEQNETDSPIIQLQAGHMNITEPDNKRKFSITGHFTLVI